MNDEQFLLANAYVDGELTDDDRRIAEADPDVMSEVGEIRALQARLANPEPPSEATREAAIAAAMSEFGTGATSGTDTAAPVIPHRTRPAMSRYLGIAAAVVAVGLLGVVVATSGLGGGDDDDAGADMAAEPAAATGEATAEDSGDEGERSDAAEQTAEMAVEEAAEEGADSDATVAAEIAEDGTFEGEMSEEMAESAPADDGATAAEDGGEEAGDELIRVTIDREGPVTGAAELASLGTLLLELERDDQLGPTPNTRCPIDLNILGATDLVDQDIVTPIYVAVLEDERIVLAVEQDSCVVLLEAPLFEPRPGP